MIFGINEKGDLNIDKDFNCFSDIILGEEIQTNMNLAKTIILTKFKHQNWFKEEFVPYKRNVIKDSEIREYIDQKLEEIFVDFPYLKSNVGYVFLNEGSTFTIVFYYRINQNLNKNLLFRTIDI